MIKAGLKSIIKKQLVAENEILPQKMVKNNYVNKWRVLVNALSNILQVLNNDYKAYRGRITAEMYQDKLQYISNTFSNFGITLPTITAENKITKDMKESKQTIRLNESQLRQIIKESIKNILNEMHSTDGMGWMGLQFDEEDWTPVNTPQEGDTCYKVKLWPGMGYTLDPFKVYAQKDDYEGALEYLVAYLDKKGNDKYFVDDWVNDEIAELKQQGYSEEEIDEEVEKWGNFYVDATMQGASKPHWLRGENLAIQEFNGE